MSTEDPPNGAGATGRRPDATQDAADHTRTLAALGQRTAEMVHDFNNLFQGLIGTLDALRTHIAGGRLAEADRLIDGATAAIQSAADSSRRLLGFVRRERSGEAPLDVKMVVTALAPLIRGAVGESVSVDLNLADALAPILCDRNALENAILNLATNARDAMPNGGALTLAAAETQSKGSNGLSDGDYVCVSVTDTGVGMSEAVRARALEPFFTTKPLGKGTGLGLALLDGFMQQAHGMLKIDSAPGAGTSFHLYFPAYVELETSQSAPGAPMAATRAAGHQSILVVEDEVVVRSLIADVLREAGYTVVEAADGPEGLAILLGADALDLVISDIGLPGLGGREMVEVARAQRPGLKVLLITGHALETPPLSGAVADVIVKPFAMNVLAARVGEMLAQA